jgi:peptidoglycan/LPS O-acetylase OafA/YrhL
MRQISYSPSLDGLRTICIVFTLLYHVDGVPNFINGSIGVDVFFPLSGFLITGILLRNGWSDLKGYYIRRLFRIAPVYYLSLGLTALLALAAHNFSMGESRLHQLGNILLPSLLFSRELASGAPTLFAQAWTVGVEEKFYLVWPIIFLLLGSRLRLGFLLAAFLIVYATGSPLMLRGYGGIALGCIASILFFKNGFYLRTIYGALAFLLAYTFCLYADFWFENLAIAAASALLIPSLYASESGLSKILSRPWLVYLGRLTFSIYMLHVIVFFAAKIVLKLFSIDNWAVVFIIGYTATVLVSWQVYELYENPLIQLGKRLAASGMQDAAKLDRSLTTRVDQQVAAGCDVFDRQERVGPPA